MTCVARMSPPPAQSVSDQPAFVGGPCTTVLRGLTLHVVPAIRLLAHQFLILHVPLDTEMLLDIVSLVLACDILRFSPKI